MTWSHVTDQPKTVPIQLMEITNKVIIKVRRVKMVERCTGFATLPPSMGIAAATKNYLCPKDGMGAQGNCFVHT